MSLNLANAFAPKRSFFLGDEGLDELEDFLLLPSWEGRDVLQELLTAADRTAPVGSRRCRHDRSHLGKRRLQCGAESPVPRAAHPPLACGFVVSAGHQGSLRERVARHSISESGDTGNSAGIVLEATARDSAPASALGPTPGPLGTPWPPFPPPRPSPLDSHHGPRCGGRAVLRRAGQGARLARGRHRASAGGAQLGHRGSGAS
jgi:hypothetical protein